MGRKRRETPEECTKNAQAMPLAWGGYIIRPTDAKYSDIREAPNEPGIYAWYSSLGDLMYIGRSKAIATRLRQHREGTLFTMTPTLFSFRVVPYQLVEGVEVAHIDALDPPENRYRDSSSTPFQADMIAAIDAAWRDVLPAQKERVYAAYSAYMEQIAARL